MRKKIIGIFVCTLLILASTSLTTLADWEPGDGHKMHWPQLPNPFGWDVDATYVDQIWPQNVLADDWMCTETGPVEDIHFWGSWSSDIVGTISAFAIAIHADIPANQSQTGYSMPGETLWDRMFDYGEWVEAGPWEGPQGWYDPAEGAIMPENHFLYWQYNIENITDPFIQENGTIYWLAISAIVIPQPEPQPRWGWKTCLPEHRWNDDACWTSWDELNWIEMYEPFSAASLNLAFVITGGPSNHPPNTPSKPSGPTSVTEGIQYTYTTITTDPDGDNVKYGWDFDGDGVVEPGHWTPFFSSGAPCIAKITFHGAGTRYLSVIAEDVHGAQSGFSPTLIVVVSGANNVPNTPNTPSGPSSGNTETSYIYTTSTTDPDGDNVKYGWDWNGNGIVDEWTGFFASGTTYSIPHSWPTAGTYNVRVMAEDSNGAQSGFSSAKTVVINDPPNKPTITGPTSGKTGNSYTYSSSTTDPDGDQIYYLFDWDDDSNSGWKGPYNSGQTASVSHVWIVKGTYQIKVKAKDINGAEGVWSDPLPISMPRNKAINTPFLRFLEQHPRMFLILRYLLDT
jgi:hypothetical protein